MKSGKRCPGERAGPSQHRRLARRSKIVLGRAEGLSNVEVDARCGVEPHTVAMWRRRFLEGRLDGLVDDPRPGRPASITSDQVEDLVVATLESTPKRHAPVKVVGLYLNPP